MAHANLSAKLLDQAINHGKVLPLSPQDKQAINAVLNKQGWLFSDDRLDPYYVAGCTVKALIHDYLRQHQDRVLSSVYETKRFVQQWMESYGEVRIVKKRSAQDYVPLPRSLLNQQRNALGVRPWIPTVATNLLPGVKDAELSREALSTLLHMLCNLAPLSFFSLKAYVFNKFFDWLEAEVVNRAI